MSIGAALSNEPELSVEYATRSLTLREEIDKEEEQQRVQRQMAELDVFQQNALAKAERDAFEIRRKNWNSNSHCAVFKPYCNHTIT